MGVYQIRREMPAAELKRWFAHLELSAEERERARKKAEAEQRNRRGRF